MQVHGSGGSTPSLRDVGTKLDKHSGHAMQARLILDLISTSPFQPLSL